MTNSSTRIHSVFSFGTLLDEKVQQHLFNRVITPSADSLSGYELTEVVIEDPAVLAASGLAVHRGLIRRLGSAVQGGVITLDDDELAVADAYEVSDYARRRVRTVGNGNVWAYVDARPLAASERIALIGDSIAYGRSDPSGGWAAQLATAHIDRSEPRNRFFNLAVPGATTDDVLRAHLVEALDRLVDTVIIAAGVNDLMHGAERTPPNIEHVISHIDQTAEMVEAQGARPIVIGPLWHDEQRTKTEFGAYLSLTLVRALDRALVDWCALTFRDYISVYDVLESRGELLVDDLHPGSVGHALIAQKILSRSYAVSTD